jgi:hypothetical protein
MGLDQSSLLLASLTGRRNCRVYARLGLAKIGLVLGPQARAELKGRMTLPET